MCSFCNFSGICGYFELKYGIIIFYYDILQWTVAGPTGEVGLSAGPPAALEYNSAGAVVLTQDQSSWDENAQEYNISFKHVILIHAHVSYSDGIFLIRASIDVFMRWWGWFNLLYRRFHFDYLPDASSKFYVSSW